MELQDTESDTIKTRLWNKDFLADTSSLISFQPPALKGFSIYTDGSLIDDRVGYGCIAYCDDLVLGEVAARASDHATVFQAEILAIIEAALFITANRTIFSNKNVTIHKSDLRVRSLL